MKLKTLWILLLALLMAVSAAAEPIKEYDDAGRLTAIVMPDGLREEYDENGRPILTIFPDGSFTRSEYDDAGNLIRTSYQDGSYTEYEYDEEGRMHRFIRPDGSFEEYEYGENGLPCRIFDENGDTIVEFEYHENGNLRREVRSDADCLDICEYDEDGKLVCETVDHSDDFYDGIYEYSNGVLIRETTATLRKEYYDTGVIKSVYHFNEGTTYFYNDLGSIVKLLSADGSYIIYRNDEKGNPLTAMHYDDNGNFLTHTLAWYPDANSPEMFFLEGLGIARDDVGNLTHVDESLPDIQVEEYESGYVEGSGYMVNCAFVQVYNRANDQRSVYYYAEDGSILKIHREYHDKETIRAAQEALNAAGYDCGAPDGVIGKGTATAVAKYQANRNLTVTGTVTHEMLIELGVIADENAN